MLYKPLNKLLPLHKKPGPAPGFLLSGVAVAIHFTDECILRDKNYRLIAFHNWLSFQGGSSLLPSSAAVEGTDPMKKGENNVEPR